ncbi:MAG: SpoIIE family protein phosphatase, partial [Magnetococcales bacterium]|nr:SpoIIE family protein phosphatase [Magnetococcales bacterium]
PWISGTLLLLGDCTGHGVPGAFITLIANGALDQALLETPPGDTATLLQRMHQLIQAALGQDHQEGASNDGLELGACYLDPYQPNLTFSGARFSLFVAEETQVQEIKGVKSGLGYRGVDWNVEFKNHEVPLNPDWCYYMTSDGLIDQVGGTPKRGFGKQRFTQLIASLRSQPIAQHGVLIKEALITFQGDETRRDDVSVVGFKGIVR